MHRLAFLCVLLSCVPATLRADNQLSIAGFPRDLLSIVTASARQHRFEVLLARTAAQQERGLMFVSELPADSGMLFVQEPPRVMSMWMKNTLIPLDMLFIADDGRIVAIHARATPQSLAIIGYDKPVRAVLELRGGEAAARSIHAGDIVQGPWFRPLAAH
jgi:uncharacterized membrane protein (UPF0127 family)